MSNHQDLVAPYSVHPFAFVQSTDPSLDPTNGVAANKAWVDTSVSPTLLKIRNGTNSGWNTILGGVTAAPYLRATLLSGPFMTALVTGAPELFPVTPTLLTHI